MRTLDDFDVICDPVSGPDPLSAGTVSRDGRDDGVSVRELDASRSGLIELPHIPVPPLLSEACGYVREGRYIALWWEAAGDELRISDGTWDFCGADGRAWLVFTQHAAVRPHLGCYHLGKSDRPAEHALVLDRWRDVLKVAPLQEALAFVQGAARAQGLPSPLESVFGPDEIDRIARTGLAEKDFRRVETALGCTPNLEQDGAPLWLEILRFLDAKSAGCNTAGAPPPS
jgi:hypothetical protein